MRGLFLILAVLLLSDCTRPGSIKKEPISSSLALNQEPTQTVISFLKWYRQHYDTINQFQLVNNYRSTDKYDSTRFYSVNFSETEKYLSEIKESGYVSDQYIKKWKSYFLNRELNFKANLQNEGPPDGFEFDFILRDQEPKYTLEGIESIKLISAEITSTSANVIINITMELNFTLTRHYGKWLIDDIENSRLE